MGVKVMGFLPAVKVPLLVIERYQEMYRIDPEVQVELWEGMGQLGTVWKWRVVRHSSGDLAAMAVVFSGDTGQWQVESYKGPDAHVIAWLVSIGVHAKAVLGTPALRR